MTSTSCPQDPEILAWITGGSLAESIRAHLDACGACRLRRDRLQAEVSVLRHLAAEVPVGSGTQAAGLPEEPEREDHILSTDASDKSSDFSEAEALPAPEDNTARPDSIGRYRIAGELDSGGQAIVYRAIHPTLPRDVAIKIAREPSPIDHSLLKADAGLLSDLDYPNLVRVHDLDTHEGRPFVVMEYVPGRNLRQLAEQALPPPRQAAAWVAAIARALEYIHCRGVVHQDIKPENIMVDESGRPRLIDFGMARWRHAWSGKRSGPSGGTVAYMAPEQARGETERIAPPSDIFALGAVLYFLLTGESPFGGRTHSERWRRASQCDFDRSALSAKHVPCGLERIVLKAMAAQPEDRYPSAEDMANALEAFLHRPRRLARQARALLLTALVVGGCCLWLRSGREPKPGGQLDPMSGTSPNQAKPEPSPEPAPATRPLRIESLRVVLRRRAPDDPIGVVGVETFAGRLDQDVRIRATLSRPAFCYLIALNPDGKTQLCYPKGQAIEPSSAAAIDYPSDPVKGFSLTDGIGVQAFVLVASTKPLPSFAKWSKALGDLPWKPAESQLVWRYDGHDFESDIKHGNVYGGVRGSERRLADLPQPLEATCRALRAGSGVEAVQVVAFPVKPQPEEKHPQRPG
jgi:serine/threonine protein kinase